MLKTKLFQFIFFLQPYCSLFCFMKRLSLHSQNIHIVFMLELIFKGIIIGLFISVPMGPIGILCLQRTLDRGRKYGVFTGLGATTSDLLYTIVALFFIGFVADFLENNRFIIQLIGSIVVIGFGFFTFYNNPSTQPKPETRPDNSLPGDYFSAMILTLSNPLILFVLIALFARFEFLDESTNIFNYIVGIASILGGAFLWWNILTYTVSRFRSKLTLSGLKLLNKLVGIIIASIGVIGVAIIIITHFS